MPHRADNSNELPDLHTTQTPAREVHASMAIEWQPTCLHNMDAMSKRYTSTTIVLFHKLFPYPSADQPINIY